VVENAVQPFVQIGHVVSAIEVVIHIDLPVTGEGITPSFEKMKIADGKGCDLRGKVAEEFLQRRRRIVERDKYKLLPDSNANWNQAVLRAIEIAYAGELWGSFQRAIEAIRPAVIRAAQMLHDAAWNISDCGCMMPAYIVES